MKVLVVSQNLPYPSSGASTRNYHLLKALCSEHDVALVAMADEAEIEEYAEAFARLRLAKTTRVIARPAGRGKRVKQLLRLARGQSYVLSAHTSPRVQAAIDELTGREPYDLVYVESALMGGYRMPEGAKVIIDQHNMEFEVLQRSYKRQGSLLRKGYNWAESKLLASAEIARCRRAALVVVTSERERIAFERLLPSQRCVVVPNGVDTDYFASGETDARTPVRPHQVVYTGSMDYFPNVDAVLYFAARCWPTVRERVPDATWMIVGRNPPPEIRRLAQTPGVTVTGSVNDVRPYLGESAVALAPLRIGGGTRLKILEALAMRKAVVSTALGCEGLDVVHGTHLLVADGPDGYSEAVIELLQDPAKRDELGSRGRALVESAYSWERCGARLLRAVQQAR